MGVSLAHLFLPPFGRVSVAGAGSPMPFKAPLQNNGAKLFITLFATQYFVRYSVGNMVVGNIVLFATQFCSLLSREHISREHLTLFATQ